MPHPLTIAPALNSGRLINPFSSSCRLRRSHSVVLGEDVVPATAVRESCAHCVRADDPVA